MNTAYEYRVEKSLELISAYGDTDGEHHKQWLLDQIVRVLTGCTIEINNYPQGVEEEIMDDSEQYAEWKRQYSDGEDGANTYDEWDTGIAP